jgi:hypothetical protein
VDPNPETSECQSEEGGGVPKGTHHCLLPQIEPIDPSFTERGPAREQPVIVVLLENELADEARGRIPAKSQKGLGSKQAVVDRMNRSLQAFHRSPNPGIDRHVEHAQAHSRRQIIPQYGIPVVLLIE